VSGPTPTSCLNAAGLLNARATQVSSWQALDPTNKQPVFVVGPYTNPGAAKASARSLSGIEEEAAGGLYAVTAKLTSKLGFKVDAVAQCLSATSGKGVVAF
jgi:hypothetical protein